MWRVSSPSWIAFSARSLFLPLSCSPYLARAQRIRRLSIPIRSTAMRQSGLRMTVFTFWITPVRCSDSRRLPPIIPLTPLPRVEENKQVTAQINDLVEKMVSQADGLLSENPRDVNALYARAWARSMKSIYVGLVQHGFISGLHLALQSRSDSDKILQIDPSYVDADLVVGVHQYVVGALPFAVKMMAGVVGEGGTKQRGLALLREAGQNGVITSVEARTALMLFLRREAKYPEAAQVAKGLKDQYPRDFLFWLEEANLMKDSGDAAQAIAHYRAVLEQAKKPDFFPNAHLELAWYGLGDTLRGQHQTAEAAAAFDQVAMQPNASLDLRRRAELAAGEQYDILHNRQKATAEYQAVLRDGASSPQASDAEKFLRSPFAAQ
jgi:hypothetical protein